MEIRQANETPVIRNIKDALLLQLDDYSTKHKLLPSNMSLLAATYLDTTFKSIDLTGCVDTAATTIELTKFLKELIPKALVTQSDEDNDEDNSDNLDVDDPLKLLLNQLDTRSLHTKLGCKYSTVIQEMKAYTGLPADSMSQFYSTFHKEIPRLTHAASSILHIPATSVPCERLFSRAGFQVNFFLLCYLLL